MKFKKEHKVDVGEQHAHLGTECYRERDRPDGKAMKQRSPWSVEGTERMSVHGGQTEQRRQKKEMKSERK